MSLVIKTAMGMFGFQMKVEDAGNQYHRAVKMPAVTGPGAATSPTLGFIGNDQLPKRPSLTPSGNVSTVGLTLSPDLATPGSFQGNIFINGVSVPVAVVNGVVYGPDGKI